MYKAQPTSLQVRWSVHHFTTRHTANTRIFPRVTVTANTVTQSASDGTGRHSPNAKGGKATAVVSSMSPLLVQLSSSVGHFHSTPAAPLLRPNSLVSVCQTRPKSNPGRPQGGAQTRRSPWGGGGGGKRHWAPKPNVVSTPNGATQARIQTQETAYTPKIKDYNTHQTTNIYTRYIAGGGPIKTTMREAPIYHRNV